MHRVSSRTQKLHLLLLLAGQQSCASLTINKKQTQRKNPPHQQTLHVESICAVASDSVRKAHGKVWKNLPSERSRHEIFKAGRLKAHRTNVMETGLQPEGLKHVHNTKTILLIFVNISSATIITLCCNLDRCWTTRVSMIIILDCRPTFTAQCKIIHFKNCKLYN